MKENKPGINKAIICKGCGRKVGTIKLKPALKELFDKKNRKETLSYIILIAFVTQFITQLISDLILRHYGL